MPQMLNAEGLPHKMCPVRSFENYLHKLNKNIPSLWQQPLKEIPQDPTAPWYIRQVMGHNPIDQFFSKLSYNVGLSKHYTNHCIRVTGTTYLTKRNFTVKQIMSITGHKSIKSLAINQKVCVGISLTYSLLKLNEVAQLCPLNEEEIPPVLPNNNIPTLPAPNQASIAPVVPEKQNILTENAVVLFVPEFDNNDDVDLMTLIADIQNDNDDDLVLAASQVEQEMS